MWQINPCDNITLSLNSFLFPIFFNLLLIPFNYPFSLFFFPYSLFSLFFSLLFFFPADLFLSFLGLSLHSPLSLVSPLLPLPSSSSFYNKSHTHSFSWRSKGENSVISSLFIFLHRRTSKGKLKYPRFKSKRKIEPIIRNHAKLEFSGPISKFSSQPFIQEFKFN